MSHANPIILHRHPELDSGSQGPSATDSGSMPGMTVQYVILNLFQDLKAA